ncbi:MAG: DUF262 domain-containing protein [Bacteroidales bacterium]|nr:DUF262 domain-containing protein [Bacteroidales bacterium]
MNKEDIYPFDEELKSTEEKASWEDDHADIPPNDIVAYNELRSCADIVRMWKNGQLTIQPDFQRELVWKKPEQTRFIDSLIKQLPIPSMCISLDFNSNKRLVIDGLQRISTIISFLTNNEYQLSALEDIDQKISGKTVSTIKAKNKTYYERVENLTIPITVLRCNYEKQSHMEYLFTIFHRLNSGGSKLNNQEIRNCIYNGKLNSFLRNSVKYPNYKLLFNIENDKIYRFAFEELNLRFFAFSEKLNKYNGRLAKFLNDYMYEKEKNPKVAKITDNEIEIKRKHFQKTIDVLYSKVFNNQSIEKLSKTLSEAVLVGVGKNINYIESLTNSEASALFNNVKQDSLFSVESLKGGLSQKAKVINRLNRAIEIFAGN